MSSSGPRYACGVSSARRSGVKVGIAAGQRRQVRAAAKVDELDLALLADGTLPGRRLP